MKPLALEDAVMILADCEIAIRNLCHRWRDHLERENLPSERPSFQAFLRWFEDEGYGRHIKYLETVGEIEAAEAWFEEELRSW
ncbi:hypothetical protein [Roseivivax marinus]|uniref:hypothetical protein n=1 Tax=Roseivivax marinus TaxID=1379903 RepID=UPI00273F45B7|nr:hypothetical protein [Roseivivax marinus]